MKLHGLQSRCTAAQCRRHVQACTDLLFDILSQTFQQSDQRRTGYLLCGQLQRPALFPQLTVQCPDTAGQCQILHLQAQMTGYTVMHQFDSGRERLTQHLCDA